MKLKKILSAVLASAIVAGASAISAFAVNDGEAAYCFDKDTKMAGWTAYGSVEQTGLEITHTEFVSKNGNGSILLSQNFGETPSDEFGGYYVESSSFDLEDFGGCTVEMSLLLAENGEGHYDNLSLFSDGIIWMSQSASGLSTKEWTTVTLVLPEDAENTRIGFTIPTLSPTMCDIVYIDDFSITKADGTLVANTGDYVLKKIHEEDTVSTGTNIVLTIVLVVLILAIVGGIGLIVSSALKRFV